MENNILSTNNNKLKITTTGKIFIGITGGVAVGLTVICAPFVSPALRKICLPYVPATTQQIKNVFEALAHQKGSLIDLGSGDGRIVIEAAKRNFTAHGIELNPWLVLYSKFDAFRKGVQKKSYFMRRDLWKYDLGEYDNVVVFGVSQMMESLEKKLVSECKPTTNIVACRFPLPNLIPVKTVGSGIDTVWLYKLQRI